MSAGQAPHSGAGDVAGLVADLIADGATVATAESVTGGRLVAALTSVPGSSAVVLGGIVAYASELKVSLLGVDAATLEEQGPVCADVAEQMARGARERMGARFGIATTGEAGPDSASGRPVGTAYVAVAGPLGITTGRLSVVGTRDQIQQEVVRAALRLLADVVAPDPQ